jgi:hypothetical protein
MPVINATVFSDRAYVLVQTDLSGAVFRDSFSRVSASGWTPADTGQAYAIIVGAAGDYTISGFKGRITHAAVNTDRLIVADVNMADVIFSGVFTNTAVPAGAQLEVKFTVRFVDGSNFVDARMFLGTTGTVTANLRQRIAGVDTVSSTVVIGGVTTTGVYGWKLYAVGTTLAFRAWDATTPEPQTWAVTFTTAMLSAGDVGVGSFVAPGVTTPVPIVFSHDNLLAVNPTVAAAGGDCAMVTRRNTVTGEIITLRPYIFYDEDGNLILECGQGLWWDTEPPLNVPVEYCVTGCDTQVAVTQNPGFEVSTAPWTATGGALTQDCTVAHEGSCSGRLTPTGSAIEPKITQTGFVLAAGTEAIMSAWVRSSLGWNAVRLVLDIVYSDFTVQQVVTPVEILDDNEWRYLSAAFTPPTTVNSVSFSFVALGTPTASNLFNIDQIQITQPVASIISSCETVTVTSESFWLKNPLHPCLDVEVGICNPMLEDCEQDSRVSFASMPDQSYAPNTVLLAPANRRRPIPVNRIRRDAEAVLRLIAHDCDARDAVLAANLPGDPLLWQAPAEYCTIDRYISVGPLDELNISVDHREPFRLMSLPHVVVDRPPGPSDGICGARIADLCDIYASWGAITIADLTYEDLLLGNASPDGPGQPVPPAGARTWDDVEAEFTNWDDVEAGGTRDWNELRDGL